MFDSRLIVSAISDEQKYKEQCVAFLESIALNSPNKVRIITHDGNAQFAKQLRGAYRNVEAINFAPVKHVDKRGYMVCLRAMLVGEALEEGYDAVAWMDVDCLVRDSLDEFWGDIDENVLRCIYRPKKKTNRRFQAAVVGFGNGAAMREMVGKWNIEVSEDIRWYKDQESLYELWALYRDDIQLIPLTSKYNDSKFKRDSVIWHSKEHHFEEPVFQEKYQGYLQNGIDRLGGYPWNE